MSAADTDQSEQAADTAGERSGMSERTARVVLLLVGLGAVLGIVVAFPTLAYVIVGALLCRAWDRARAWRVGRQTRAVDGEDQEEDAEEAPAGVVAALRALAEGGRHVLLTELRDAVGAPDTKAVRALLAEAGIPVRPGVRTPAGNGPGVHRTDIPAPLPADDDPQSNRCSCRSAANANANNDDQDTSGEGLRVERIGAEGRIWYRPDDRHRHHRTQRR
jgi:hypothetical protein